jgi:hypothetical protein
MQRECTACRRLFTPRDLDRTESRNMEAERKASGLVGVRFLYYTCPACAAASIFVDILPLQDELMEDFHRRRDDMEQVVRRLHADHAAGQAQPVVMEATRL